MSNAGALAGRIRRLAAAWNLVHAKRPRLLYHYTDAQGLLGMMKTQRLWATNSRFMNDPTEVGYAVGLVRRSVQEQGERYPQPLVKDVTDSTNALLDLYDNVDDKYISCFCESGDLLSQWRGYGAIGGGYSLGFVARHLGLTTYRTPERPEPVLRKVVYDQKRQRRIIDRWVSAIFDWEATRCQRTRQKPPRIDPHDQGWLTLNWFISECLYCFKDPAYDAEREWRLAQYGRNVRGERPVKTDFRASRGRIVEYVELDVTSSTNTHKGKLPIEVIRYGPTLDPKATERALRLLCEGHSVVATITRSGVPFSG
jgi:hypothetical protein